MLKVAVRAGTLRCDPLRHLAWESVRADGRGMEIPSLSTQFVVLDTLTS